MNTDYKTTWLSLASIWFGGIVSVPALLIGSTLVSSLKFTSLLIAGFLGFGIVVLLMSLISLVALKKRMASVALASSSFGDRGSKIVVGVVIASSTLGWFGVQSNIAGNSFSRILSDTFNVDIPGWGSSLFWGLVMTLTAVFGFKFLKWLNHIVVPAIIVLLAHGIYITFQEHTFQEVIIYPMEKEIPLLKAIGLIIGFISVAIVIAPDYNRFAATKKDAVLGSLFGILPSALPLLIIGAVLAITQGTHDIVQIFSMLGFPFIAMAILILATWTSNVMNIYSCGLAFNSLLGFSMHSRSTTTLIAGIFGSVLASFGVLNHFLDFITILTVTVTPIVGIILADNYIVKPYSEERNIRFNWKGIIAWGLGVAYMLGVSSDIKYIFGIVLAAFTYFILSKVMKTK